MNTSLKFQCKWSVWLYLLHSRLFLSQAILDKCQALLSLDDIFGVPGRERNLAQLTKRQCSSVRNAWRADRRFVFDHPTLKASPAEEEAPDSDIEYDEGEDTRLRKKPKKMPAKKAGKVAKGENFWGRVDEWFKAEVAERGSSLTGPKWKSSNSSEPLVPPPLQSRDEFGGYYFTIIPLLWACFGTVNVASFLSSTTTQAASLYSHRQGVPIPQVISNSIKNATQPTAPVFPLGLSSSTNVVEGCKYSRTPLKIQAVCTQESSTWLENTWTLLLQAVADRADPGNGRILVLRQQDSARKMGQKSVFVSVEGQAAESPCSLRDLVWETEWFAKAAIASDPSSESQRKAGKGSSDSLGSHLRTDPAVRSLKARFRVREVVVKGKKTPNLPKGRLYHKVQLC
ncbi:hypothetical protein B0H14DRAFT_3170309 [Mycena olivaceomarginata]|nr:hypothetical protein B0H14DRAFT_3170309 [Mycena olivaceomarginata]